MRQETIRRIFSVSLLMILFILFSSTSEYFLTFRNIQTLLREASTTGIIAIGVSMVIITAGIDLSTGAIVGFVSMFCANLLYFTHIPSYAIIFIALFLGVVSGYLNGFLVTVLRLPDFIATLSTQFLFRGLALIFAIRNATGMISNKVISDKTILFLGSKVNGIYLVTIFFLGFVIIGQFVLKKTSLGVYIYSVGANLKSANLSGINSGRIKRIVYSITGFLCGVAALFLMGKIRCVTPETGIGLEFDVIAAVVVGGCAFTGGRGDIVGTLIGTLFMSVLTNGIYKYNMPTALQLVIKGSVIILMIVFDSFYNRYMEEKRKKKADLVDPKTGANNE